MIPAKSPFLLRAWSLSAALSFSALPLGAPAADATPPKSWIDPDTGHRVTRLTDEPGSDSFYFNVNACTPDGREMAYFTDDGSIGVLDLTTLASRIVVKGPVKPVVVGRKTPSIYYIKAGEQALYRTNLDTGETQRLADIPDQGSVTSVNADETLAGGTRVLANGAEHKFVTNDGRGLIQAVNKSDMMAARLAAHLPMEMYTIDLQTGKEKILVSSNDWLNHLEFSPIDPTLLMYCHEGPWNQVDRIWLIRTDGTQNTLVHKRTMLNEGVGHEFWSHDGKTIWYEMRFPIGENFYVAGYNVETQERTWYHLLPSQFSVHSNQSPDQILFSGDGANHRRWAWASGDNEWLSLFRPELIKDVGTLGTNLVHPGIFHTEHLVHMNKHDYYLEPNAFFSPDQKYLIFRSNMFGKDYAFAVEIAKATSP